jgi:hypothetical protein
VRMPFGAHQGRPVQSLPRSYLLWLIESGLPLSARLRGEVETALVHVPDCFGPHWWHLQRARRDRPAVD